MEDVCGRLDGGEVPLVAVVFTRWSGTRYGCDVLGNASFAPAWEFVRHRCAELSGARIEMAVAPGDGGTAAEAQRAAFGEAGETYVVSWLEAADRPAVRDMPDGYRLVTRPEQSGPHPLDVVPQPPTRECSQSPCGPGAR